MDLLLAIGFVLQVAGADTSLASITTEIERAVVVGDVPALQRAQARLRTDVLDAATPLRRYTLAYVNWRLVRASGGRPGQERIRLLDEAEAHLLDIVKVDPANAEALALLGSIYGERIAGGGSPMKIGSKAIRAVSDAAERAPQNPRVALLRGIHFLFTPEPFGGGLERAEAELRRSDQLFQAQRSPGSWPDWGRVDVLAWLGQVLTKKRDYAGARAAYGRALAIEPDHGWVRSLLTELETAAKSARRPQG